MMVAFRFSSVIFMSLVAQYFRVPASRDHPKNLTNPKTLQMHHSPLRRDFQLTNQPIPYPIRIHQTIAFQPRQEKPAKGGKAEYQLSISTYSGAKPLSLAFWSIS